MKGDEYKLKCDALHFIDWDFLDSIKGSAPDNGGYDFHTFKFPRLKTYDSLRHSQKNKETDVEIIPAKELARVNDFSLEKAMRRFNEIVSGSAEQQYRFVVITEYPFVNLHLDGIFLSRCEYQLKIKILNAGYRIKEGLTIPRSVQISWPLPF